MVASHDRFPALTAVVSAARGEPGTGRHAFGPRCLLDGLGVAR